MNFILCEKSYVSYLICQNSDTNECWTLMIQKYHFTFLDWTPPFIYLVDATIKLLQDKDAIKMLEEYAAKNSSCKTEIEKFLEHYKELPF